jgi:serine/threonine protein kinase
MLRKAVRISDDRKQTFAAKLINPETMTEFLQTEGTALQLLQQHTHDHILPLCGTVETPKQSMVVIPSFHIDLRTLVAQRKQLRPEEAVEYMLQAASVLQHLHSHDIVLRDIACNRFVFPDSSCSKLALADLQHCVILPKGRHLTIRGGNPLYLAPEVFTAKTYDPRIAAAWSLGVMLYIMLTGDYPFVHQSVHGLLPLVAAGNIKYPAKFPALMRPIVQGLLTRNPEQRMTIDDIMQLRTDTLHKLSLARSRLADVSAARTADITRQFQAVGFVRAAIKQRHGLPQPQSQPQAPTEDHAVPIATASENAGQKRSSDHDSEYCPPRRRFPAV